MNDKKPNLFIIGAAKSGTTSLWSYLKEHDEVYMPKEMMYKEPGYFSDLKASFPEKLYFDLFRGVDSRVRLVGEASTAYLTDPVSASRIHSYNPNAKIIVTLRNPASRAYSLYSWMVQEGYEHARTFEKALKLEPKRKATKIPNGREIEYYYNYLYFESGCYYKQIKRYLGLFDSKNVHLMCFEDFLSNQKIELEKLCDFLNIEYMEFDFTHENPSQYVISPKLQFLLRKLIMFQVKRGLIDNSSKRNRDKLLEVGKIGFLRPRKISPVTYRSLMAGYKEDIRHLQALTNINFSSKWPGA